jgi:hypothetical protein
MPDLSKIQKAFEASMPKTPNLGAIMPTPPDLRPLMPPVNHNLASEFRHRLVTWVNDFDRSLDQAHEVGVRLVSFGQTVVFHLHGIGYWNPSLISFSGETDDGNPVELIQHVSQISILVMKLPRKNPEQPKKPIGFSSECEPSSNPSEE